MIVNKVQLIGADGTEEYSPRETRGNITVRASSRNCEPSQGDPIHYIVPLIRGIITHVLAAMSKRSYINGSPYVILGGPWALDHSGEVMYAEDSYMHHNQLVRTHGGMDVFVKKWMSPPRSGIV